ncbi:hypothetical protein KFE25_014208 [Diacronema lutheri]|uniref:SET domain-containing protein n=1 Tax=Diacronema lutheri TaxID=2081491 RepID=A0A8J5XAU0_DIALT|nr:hypothetical protein KFE25_014208 [Diacronema lutheri]
MTGSPWISPSVRVGPSTAGGGRGVFAMRPIEAGELLMAEQPDVLCPAEPRAGETLHVALARELLALPRARAPDGGWAVTDARVAALLGRLHPRSLEGLAASTAGVRSGAPDLEHDLAPQLGYLARLPRAGSSPELSRAELLRLLLQVRMNAFASGLYCELSMINHACAPSAIKFAREDGGVDGMSRVCALRHIPAGGEVTINYLPERLLSHGARRAALLEQHRFAIAPSPFAPPLELACSKGDGGPDGARQLVATAALGALEAELDALSEALPQHGGAGAAGTLALVAARLLRLYAPPPPPPPPLSAPAGGPLAGHLARARLCRLLAQALSEQLRSDGAKALGDATAARAMADSAVCVLRCRIELSRAYERMACSHAPARAPSAEDGAARAGAPARWAVLLPAHAQEHLIAEHYECAANALGFLIANAPARLLAQLGEHWPSRARACVEQHALLCAAAVLCALYAPAERRAAVAPVAGGACEKAASVRGAAAPGGAALDGGAARGGALQACAFGATAPLIPPSGVPMSSRGSGWELFD